MEVINIKHHYLKIVTVVNITIGLLLLASLVFFARNIISVVQKKDMKPLSTTKIESKKHENKSIQEYEAIFQNNPFGIPAGSLKHNSAGMDQTALSGIKLIGTISGSAKYGYAVFVGTDGKQSMFKTGESVFGAGELKTVEKYRAVIENNGKLIKIPMVDIMAPGEMEALKGAGALSGSVRSLGKGEYIIDQKAVQFAVDNPNQIMTDAKLIPNMIKEKQEGFILRQVRKNGIYDSLGMQNGDILLSINNFSISNPENALQAFTALKGMDKVQLEIIRDSNRMTMNYQIR
ncbi:MAG: type II secretion system protein N [Syntrophales bacterium]|jgi:type II secretion system protein C